MKITLCHWGTYLLLVVASGIGVAQDKTDAPAKPEAPKLKTELKLEDEKPKVDAKVAWKKLAARKLEIFNTLQKLKKDFAAAEGREAQAKIRDEFSDLIREFQVEIEPQLVELGEEVYAGDPGNQEAAEIVMQKAFNENQFDKSLDIATKLMAAKYKPNSVAVTAAISQYATHHFEEASAQLAELEKDNKLGSRYAQFPEAAKNYVEFWKQEQELRAAEEKLEGDKALPRVTFNTNKGAIVLELFEDQAPNTVANFISLVEAKKYDGIKFHRVINGFMAQGGDPNTLNDDPLDDGQGGPGHTIKCECYEANARKHFRGSLSMAHAGRDTGGSQFFITHLPTAWLNPNAESQRGHTVFGRIVEGLDLAMALRKGDKIETAVVTRKRPHDYKPVVVSDNPTKEEKPTEKTKDAEKTKDETKTEKPKSEDAPKSDSVKKE